MYKKEKSRNSTNIYRSTMISLTSKTHTRKAVFLQTTKSFSRDVTWGWITRRGFARMTHVSFLRVTPESRNIKYKIVRETPIWTHSYHDIEQVETGFLVLRARITRVANHLTADPHEVSIDSSAPRKGRIASTFWRKWVEWRRTMFRNVFRKRILI